MGFGHRVYKNYDPRAKIIKKAADDVFEVTGTNPLLDIALELEKIALEDDYFVKRKLYPNVDFYSGLIYEALGMPVGMFPVLFAIPRTSGWIAQWLEMIDDKEQKIARPRQIYTGDARRATTCRWATAADVPVEFAAPSADVTRCGTTASESPAGRRLIAARAVCARRPGGRGLADARRSRPRRRRARRGSAPPRLGRGPLRGRRPGGHAGAQGARARAARRSAPAVHRSRRHARPVPCRRGQGLRARGRGRSRTRPASARCCDESWRRRASGAPPACRAPAGGPADDHRSRGGRLEPAELGARVLATLGETFRWTYGALWRPDEAAGVLRCATSWHAPSGGQRAIAFAKASQDLTFAPGWGLPGRVWAFTARSGSRTLAARARRGPVGPAARGCARRSRSRSHWPTASKA